MNDLRLPLPNPEEWMTIKAAADLLGISERQVIRIVAENRIKAYWPQQGKGERQRFILWAAEVQRYADARKILKSATGA